MDHDKLVVGTSDSDQLHPCSHILRPMIPTYLPTYYTTPACPPAFALSPHGLFAHLLITLYS